MLKKSLCFSAAIIGSLALPAAAQDAVTLKFAHWVPATHPLHSGGWAPWAKSIEETSGGTLKVQFYPAGQLGKPADHYDIARDGIADFGWLNPGFNPGRWVIASAGTIPMLIKEAKNSSAAFTEWYVKYAAKEMGDVKLCMLHSMHPGTVFSKKPMQGPADFKGMKYRASNTMEALYVRNHGGTLVNAPQPEIRDILARGVADGTFNIMRSAIAWGIHKEAKYVLDMSWGSPVYALVMNKAKYESLPAKAKSAVDTHCTAEWAKKFITAADDWEAQGRDLLLKEGNVLYKPDAEQMKQWRAGVAAVKQAWEKEVSAKGHDPKPIYAELEAALKRHGSLME
jgi:TRAP-type C4-dicarboxylate transport system substrate-binding protein